MSNQTINQTQSEEEAELERLLEKAKAEGNLWLPQIGVFKDNPLFDEWQQAIQDNRRKADENLNF